MIAVSLATIDTAYSVMLIIITGNLKSQTNHKHLQSLVLPICFHEETGNRHQRKTAPEVALFHECIPP